MLINFEMMIEKVQNNLDEIYRDFQGCKRNSFKWRGLESRMKKANMLLGRLMQGNEPSTYEVVAYFGKGARFTP